MCSIALTSCNQEDIIESSVSCNTTSSAEVITQLIPNDGEIMIPFTKSPLYFSKEGYLPDYQNNQRLAIHGPYRVEPGQGTLTMIKGSEKIRIISEVVNGAMATGVYFFDVYQYTYTVNIPDGGVVKAEIADPCGYSDYYSQTKGVLVNSVTEASGKTYVVLKFHSIVPRYNMLGQAIGGPVLPTDLRKCPFVYYVIV